MAHVDLRLVRQSIRQELLANITNPTKLTVAYENVDFTPPNPGDYYLRESLQPVLERKVASGLIEGIGRVVYDVFYPEGKGTEVAEDLATEISNIFEAATSLQHQGIDIAIDRTERSPGLKVDDVWYIIPVVINWRTYAQATT